MNGTEHPVVQHLVMGPQRHGVVRHGLGLASAAASGEGLEHRLLRGEIGRPPRPGAGGVLHVSFTDHLFGPGPEAAVDAVLDLAEAALLSVGVHDVPQPQEGRERFARRATAYRRLIAAADAVIANSRHEAAQLLELCPQARQRLHVVPLPLEQPAGPAPTRQGAQVPAPAIEEAAAAPVVGLLGFVYPGKGYEAVVEAVPAGTRIRVLGAVAEGHADYADGLAARAAERGVGLEITGFVPEAELARALASIDVPVCPHRHVSASGSLNTWIAHGRVPLALEGPYMREVAQRWPGRVRLCAPDELAAQLGALLGAPGSTRSETVTPAWGWPQVAAACEDVWRRLLP